MAPTETAIGKKRPIYLLALALAFCGSGSARADFDNTIENVLKFGQNDGRYGQLTLDLNYRYEYADTEDTAPKSANANTFRLRLGYLSPQFKGLQGFVEYESLLAAQNDYNGLTYGSPAFHTIADPADKHELNRLWISYQGIPDTLIKGGRQRIKLDDDRFIGNVGWRQMEQTFDSVVVTNSSIENLTAKAGYIGRVRNILSLTDNMETPFVNVHYNFGNIGGITGYGYWLDYTDDKANYAKSSQTYGVRALGSPKINDALILHYLAEYSYQADYESNPGDYDVDRYNLMGGVTVSGITAQAGMEQLGGKGMDANKNRLSFQTPLGTNHAFQGWADRFLVTPADGIRDVNFTLSGQVFSTNLSFVYHNFKDDTGHTPYGDEYDFLAIRKFGNHYSILAKYAYYVADEHAPAAFQNDTQKIWIQGNISF